MLVGRNDKAAAPGFNQLKRITLQPEMLDLRPEPRIRLTARAEASSLTVFTLNPQPYILQCLLKMWSSRFCSLWQSLHSALMKALGF